MHKMYSTLYNMYSIMTNDNHANPNKHLKMLPFKIQRSEFCGPKHMTVREPKRMKSKTNLVNKNNTNRKSTKIQWKQLRLVTCPIT